MEVADSPPAGSQDGFHPGEKQHITCVLGEADGQGAVYDLLLKEVLLIQEKDDGCVCEPLVVTDAVEQLHALMHPVLSRQPTTGFSEPDGTQTEQELG